MQSVIFNEGGIVVTNVTIRSSGFSYPINQIKSFHVEAVTKKKVDFKRLKIIWAIYFVGSMIGNVYFAQRKGMEIAFIGPAIVWSILSLWAAFLMGDNFHFLRVKKDVVDHYRFFVVVSGSPVLVASSPDRDFIFAIQAALETALHGHLPTSDDRPKRNKERAAPDPRPASPDNEQDALDLLGLAKPYTLAELDARRKAMLLKVHPDHGGSNAMARMVNDAYLLLKDKL